MSATPTSVLLRVIFFLSMLLVLMIFNHPVRAHDPDHEDHDKWYTQFKSPDTGFNCCGIGDGYFCDDFRMANSKQVCTITDDRDDDVRGRVHIPLGTVIEIPNAKLIDAAQASKNGNPTGHGIIWVKPQPIGEGWMVFCYVAPVLM